MRRILAAPVAALAALALFACEPGPERDRDVPPPQRGEQPPGEQRPGEQPGEMPPGEQRGEMPQGGGEYAQQPSAEEGRDARELVEEATNVVERMKEDPQLADLLQRAEGVFIVPEFGEGALVAGARGGQGVLLARHEDRWSGPLFYDVGAISLGAQAGGTSGDVVMLLMSDRALEGFRDDENFSLDADAGLTLADYSERAQARAGEEDVILWSDLEGAFAGVSLSVTDISLDEEEIHGYYESQATPDDVISGKVESRYAESLRRKLQG